MNLNRFRRTFWLRVNQVSTLGLAGMGLMLGALILWSALVQADQRELVKLNRTLEAMHVQEAQRNALPINFALGKEEQIDILYRAFPMENQLPESLRQLYLAAEKNDLVLETGEYTRTRIGHDRLVRYRVMLPVKGTFKQVLSFMDKVLKDPAVALENATFKRDKVDDVQIDAKLNFTLFLNAKP